MGYDYCSKCASKIPMKDGMQRDGRVCSVCKSKEVEEKQETPLLTIEVQDMNSVPVVKFNGKDVTNKVSVEYRWQTDQFRINGEHFFKTEHIEKIGNALLTQVKTLSNQ